MIYVLYHANCYDGFGAAYSAWKCFGNDATYIPVSYGNPLPDMPNAQKVYIVDFSYPPEILLELSKKTHVVVLDHHKTAQEFLTPLIGINERLYIEFDMNRSGALMAWEYFNGNPVPKLIQHISDRDLWKFELDGSKEVHAALVSLAFDFKVWDELNVDDLIQQGKACLQFQNELVNKIVEKSWIGKVGDYNVPIVNTASSWAEVGNALCKKYPDAPFAASFTILNDKVMWSLRSIGDFDVSEVAKKFGGGGHKNAAGFRTARY